MPTKPTTVYTLISTDDKHDPRVEEFDMLSALKIRMRGVQAGDPQYKLLVDGREASWDWSEPDLIIGGTAPIATAKPRAKRRTKAEMEAARAAKQEARKPAPTAVPGNGQVHS